MDMKLLTPSHEDTEAKQWRLPGQLGHRAASGQAVNPQGTGPASVLLRRAKALKAQALGDLHNRRWRRHVQPAAGIEGHLPDVQGLRNPSGNILSQNATDDALLKWNSEFSKWEKVDPENREEQGKGWKAKQVREKQVLREQCSPRAHSKGMPVPY